MPRGPVAQWIQANYEHLMQPGQDPDDLLQFVLSNIQSMVGHGISQPAFKKLRMDLQRAAMKGGADAAFGLQHALTNFLLRGEGLGVIENAQYAIASMITEDRESVRLTVDQMALKRLVETHSRFKVAVIGQQSGQQFI